MQHRLLTAALLQGFGTARELATVAGVSLDTAQRYRRGETYPDALTVARLMRHSRLVVDAMLRMAGLDDLSLEQEQARLLRELLDLQQRRAPHVAAAMAAAEVRMDGTQVAPASPRGRTAAAAATGRPR
jgi:hypothetical protein